MHVLSFENRQRAYRVHLPPCYDGRTPLPLVLCFHGGGANIHEAVKTFRLDEQADKSGFIVVYPAGTGHFHKWSSWNAGGCCGYAMKANVNDVGFVSALIDELNREYKIDGKRVYAIGFSNGGQLAFKLAEELPNRFAAIASISGWMSEFASHQVHPLPVLIMHGANDKSIPLSGGDGKWAHYGVHINAFPIAKTVKHWVDVDHCNAEPFTTVARAVTLQAFTGGADGTEVLYYLISGSGHAWAGGNRAWLFANRPYQDLSTDETVWTFFSKHSTK